MERGEVVFIREGKLKGRKAIVLANNDKLVEVKIIGGAASLLYKPRDLVSAMTKVKTE